MHPLDIFSDSPHYFIFQKETNKTNFGGVLTLFFSLIIAFISILYFLDYIDLDQYSIEYSHIVNLTLAEDIPKLNSIPDINPNLTFTLGVLDYYNHPLSKSFILYDFATNEILDRENGYIKINRRISDFHIGIFYNCSLEPNCSRKKEDITDFGYKLHFSFKTHNIDLQNYPSPIKEELINSNIFIPFYYKYFYHVKYDWEIIKFIEQSTLFDRFKKEKSEYISGHISEKLYNTEEVIENNSDKGLLEVRISNDHLSYIEYKRKRKTLLDLVAKITSLFQTLRFAFLFVFKYYSKNFNNYKIIEKILDMNNKKFREIELNNVLYEPKNTNNNPNNENNYLSNPLINNSEKNNNLIINDIGTDTDDNEIDDLLKAKILPKLSFMHFFCNNLYCTQCSKFRSQETLHICNKILLKYMSIEAILYNQMKLENLFKDYNWNNPILNNIEKNDLINKLKTLI